MGHLAQTMDFVEIACDGRALPFSISNSWALLLEDAFATGS